MKKFIFLLISLLVFSACHDKFEYEMSVTYRVYYPDNVVEKTFSCPVKKDCKLNLSSSRGSNYISIYRGATSLFSNDEVTMRVESTTCPIEVLSSSVTKIGEDYHGKIISGECPMGASSDE